MFSAISVKAIKEICKGIVEVFMYDKSEIEWDEICSIFCIDANLFCCVIYMG